MGPDLYEAVQPRPDVLAGTLADAVFAASLDEVVAGTAPDDYARPAAFFAATYPSTRLRSLLDEVPGRVGGGRPDGAPVVRLETNLGGGKTHNLIALYHAARGHPDRPAVAEFMDLSLLPTEPVAQLAVFGARPRAPPASRRWTVQADFDEGWYPTGARISDAKLAAVPIEPHTWPTQAPRDVTAGTQVSAEPSESRSRRVYRSPQDLAGQLD
ncbi:MAG: hypothetical protein ACRD1K_12950 [Acidimicrobiales bacterium]